MRWVLLALGAGCFVAGLLSAFYWFQSARVRVVPLWAELSETPPFFHAGEEDPHWLYGMLKAMEKSAAINRKAAAWSAVAALLGALGTFCGAVLN